MIKSDQSKVFLWLFLVLISTTALVVNFVNSPQQYNAGLLDALEINTPSHQAAIALGKSYQQKLLLLVGNKSIEQASINASNIRQQLKKQSWLAQAYSNPFDSGKLQQFVDFYAASPFSHLSSKSIQALQEKNNNKLSKDYFQYLNQWADPIVSYSIEADQTLTIASFLKERLVTNGNWIFKHQQLILEHDELAYIPIFITVKQSHANIRDSVKIYQTLQSLSAIYLQANNLQESSQQQSEILMTGMLLHSASASRQAQAEISVFGLFSLMAVLVIVMLAFRSAAPILACLGVISCALIFGMLAITLVFDSVHLLAFVFAVSILGIAIDYGFHVLVLKQYSQASPTQIRKKVFLPLTIALISTIAGYSLFFITPLPLLHQVVVFVGAGLVGAYVSALLLLPSIEVSRTGTLFSVSLNKHFSYIFVALILFVAFIPKLNFDDKVSNLNTQSSDIVAQEKKIAQLTGESMYPYLVLVSADDQQSLLQQAKKLSQALEQSNAKIKSISHWLLPAQQQQQNRLLVKENWLSGNYQYLDEYIDKDKVIKQLNHAQPITSLPDFMVKNLGINIISLNGQLWTALLLSEPLTQAQHHIVQQNKSAQYVNLPNALSEQLAEVRLNLFKIILPAILVIIIILTLYFGITSALLMTLVPVLSAGLALELTQFFQNSLNIFNILACLLIVTLSIDYVVFFRAHGSTKLISHTISLSALSSALTFGVMFFSKTPAVSSFGITLLIGIIIAWLLSHLTPLNYKNKK